MMLSEARAVAALDALEVDDPEMAKSCAEEILLQSVEPPVRDAYMRLVQRARWWS